MGPSLGSGRALALHSSLSSSIRLIEVPKLIGRTGHSCFRPAVGLSLTVHGIWPLATPWLGQLLPKGSLRPFTWPWCVIRLWSPPPKESFPPVEGALLLSTRPPPPPPFLLPSYPPQMEAHAQSEQQGVQT